MVINPLRRALCHRIPQPLLMNSRFSILLPTKILVLSGRAQQEDIGDGVDLTVSFAGELVRKAKELIRMGLHPSEIICSSTYGGLLLLYMLLMLHVLCFGLIRDYGIGGFCMSKEIEMCSCINCKDRNGKTSRRPKDGTAAWIRMRTDALNLI
ncbi:T-complex protein 1 subunit theta isoform X2 [Eucalyptus grandis]|uniref:T-complex protein 1 subunit theta isoform X2 n=1 Tax=Eucalyptus grandis TaxID=71139 RepID=UPI00192E8A36|nr:T-complex protein 1 subunit theta isoform X2 [Eucalyptus grandis]XP_039160215.1 T-complex protein 1 subunit theta isoform X2 [Eucalyptus grandis]XP_039160216.1 T-complex protein 1 subunit theta isoform X2 [Eucalyptus grandis]